jgi:AraC-like DNA-binding protein
MPHDERQLSRTYEYRRYELPPEFPVLLASDACLGAPPIGSQPIGSRPVGAQPVGPQPIGAAQSGSRPVAPQTFGSQRAGAESVGVQLFGASPAALQAAGAQEVGPQPIGGEGCLPASQAAGSQAAGSQLIGALPVASQAFGPQPVGSQPIGPQPIGPQPVASQAIGQQGDGSGRRPAARPRAEAAAAGDRASCCAPAGAPPKLHFHNCLLIGKCLAGSGYVYAGGRRIAFRAGDAMCVPRFVPHAVSDAPAGPSRWSCILVDMGQLLSSVVRNPQSFELSQRAGDGCGYVLPEADHPGVHQLIAQISARLGGSDPAADVEILQGLFIALFYSLVGSRGPKGEPAAPGSPESPRNVVIAPALEFISDHYMQKLTVRQLAGLCLMSETHFRRTFLLLMGISPLSFLNVTRIERACAMLTTTKESILSISEEVGFSSVSSFNRCFSNIKGATPREYRNKSARSRQAREAR